MYAGQIVEHASTLDLFDNPEHPYTEALLGALPQLEGENLREGRLTAIPGPPAGPDRPAAGLPFRAALPLRGRERRLHGASRRSCARSGPGTGSARPIRRASAPGRCGAAGGDGP